MRFLTSTILSLTHPHSQPTTRLDETKFLATASWIHKRLTAPPTPSSPLTNDYLHQSCVFAATIFSLAILTRSALSQACTSDLLHKLWMAQWRVPLSRWKEIPGVFFWIVLVAAPFAQNQPMGRWHKGMIASSTISIGLVDWDVSISTLRGFLAVQRWLKGRDEGEEGEGKAKGKLLEVQGKEKEGEEMGKVMKRAKSV